MEDGMYLIAMICLLIGFALGGAIMHILIVRG